MKLKNRYQILLGVTLLIAGMLLSSCGKEPRILTLEMEVAELRCDDGLHIFEGRVLELNGIKSVTANIQSHKTIIVFHEKQISTEELKKHLLEFGFTIDGVSGNSVARSRLPSCCFEKE